MTPYPGPVRDEPLSIELHNTLYAVRGHDVDGLADAAGLAGWLAAIEDRLPVPARAVDLGERERFTALRGAIADVFVATIAGRRPPAAATEALSATSAYAPTSLSLAWIDGRLRADVGHHAMSPTFAVLGAIATDAIALVGGPHAADLHACGAPGCVLVFLRHHPRGEWCSARCGNRARQARHYARSRRG